MREPPHPFPAWPECPVKSNRAAFSLTELIVVLAVCGVIIGVGVPVGLAYYRNAQNTSGAQQITVTASASPVFDYQGRALPATTFTLTNNTTSGTTLTVSVATSRRITIP